MVALPTWVSYTLYGNALLDLFIFVSPGSLERGDESTYFIIMNFNMASHLGGEPAAWKFREIQENTGNTEII